MFPLFAHIMKLEAHVLFICIQALDTLGNTKWRINKRVLSVVDRIWAGGGRLADLVDRDDVSYSILLTIGLRFKSYFRFHC